MGISATRQSSSPSSPDIYVLVARGKDGGAVSEHLSAPPIDKSCSLEDLFEAVIREHRRRAVVHAPCKHVSMCVLILMEREG